MISLAVVHGQCPEGCLAGPASIARRHEPGEPVRARASSGLQPVTCSRNGLTRMTRPAASRTSTIAHAVAIGPSAKSRSRRTASSAALRSVTSSTVPTWPITSP